MGGDELLRNEESRELTMELDATLCQVQEAEASRCRRQRRSSFRMGYWSLARQTKPFDGGWDWVEVDQKDLDEHRNNWPLWRQTRTGEELMTDEGTRSGLKKQFA